MKEQELSRSIPVRREPPESFQRRLAGQFPPAGKPYQFLLISFSWRNVMKKLILPLLLLVAFGMLAAVESDPSEVVGYVKYPCVTGLNHIALPMDQSLAWASDWAANYPGMMDAMSYWDNASQSWVSAVDLGYWEGDFAVAPGSIMMISALSAFDGYSIGGLPATNASYTMVAGLNDIMVPLNRSDIAWAGTAGDEIGVLDAMSYWDAATQSWVSAVYLGYWEGDFAVTIGDPMQVNALSGTTWPVRSASTFGTRNK
jgi:hypothetical protein